MHLGHEFMEVDPAFRFSLRLGKEEVHQHRLAAPDAAPEIEPGYWLRPEEKSWPPLAGKALGERVELCRRLSLRRIDAEGAAVHPRLIPRRNAAHAVSPLSPAVQPAD